MEFFFATALILCFIYLVSSLRGSDEPLVVDYSEFYYYRNLEEKMVESMSINNCSLRGPGFNIKGILEGDLSAVIVPPSVEVTKRWGTKSHQTFIDDQTYAQVSKNLCTSKKFKQFKKGTFKLAKGCKQMFKLVNGVRIKEINRYGSSVCSTIDVTIVYLIPLFRCYTPSRPYSM